MARKLPKSLSQDEVNALLGEIRGRSNTALRNRAMLTILADGGLRLMEVLCLETRDLRKENGDVVALHLRITKNGHERIVPLTTRAQTLLAEWLERRTERGLPNGYVFCTLASGKHLYPATDSNGDFVRGEPSLLVELYAGGKLSAGYVRRVVKRCGVRADIQRNISPHTLRHSAAQRLYDNTGNLELVRRFLGHVRIGTTQLYAEANDHQVAEAVAALDEENGREDVAQLLGEIERLRARVLAVVGTQQ